MQHKNLYHGQRFFMVNMRINRWISGHPLLGQSDAALGHDDNIMVVPTIWWLAPLNVGRSSPRLKCPCTSLWSTSASFMLIYNMPSVHCINIFGLYSLYRYVYIHIYIYILYMYIYIYIYIVHIHIWSRDRLHPPKLDRLRLRHASSHHHHHDHHL